MITYDESMKMLPRVYRMAKGIGFPVASANMKTHA